MNSEVLSNINRPNWLENMRYAKLTLRHPHHFFSVLLFRNYINTHLSSLLKINFFFFEVCNKRNKTSHVVLTRQTTYFTCLAILFSYFTQNIVFAFFFFKTIMSKTHLVTYIRQEIVWNWEQYNAFCLHPYILNQCFEWKSCTQFMLFLQGIFYGIFQTYTPLYWTELFKIEGHWNPSHIKMW